jgi:hypothetical protein
VGHHHVIEKEHENVQKHYLPWPDGVALSNPELVTKKYAIVKQFAVCEFEY